MNQALRKVNFYSNAEYLLCYANRLYDQGGKKKELLVDYEKTDFEGDKMIWDEINQLWKFDLDNREEEDDDDDDYNDNNQSNFIDNDPLGLRS